MTDSLRAAITTSEQWQAFWSEVMANRASPRAAPPVDFQQYVVLAAALGRQPTTGYLVSIDEATSDDMSSLLKVRVRTMITGGNCDVGQVLTSPVDAVLVAKSAYPVRFMEKECDYGCGR